MAAPPHQSPSGGFATRPSFWLLLLWCSLSPALGQSPPPVRVDLGSDVAGPGEEVFVPLSYSGENSAPVTRLVLELTFPPKKLDFGALLPGEAENEAGLDTRAELIPPGDPDQEARLRVEVSSLDGLPEGELVRLSFRIAEGAEVNEEISVKEAVRELYTADGTVEADGSDGIITVIAEAFFACLFYMH